MECSNRGLCNRGTGVCSCEDDRFEGAACERKSCASDCLTVGRCLSMEYFASQKDSGSGDVFTYEDIWDAEMMYGCVCDDGYFGPDCSLRECPSGDDPLTGTTSDTYNGVQYNEKQLITCTASGGTFTLSFRGETTDNIEYDATADEVLDYFEALSTVTNDFYTAVDVDFDDDAACSVSGNKFTIEFLQDFGDLPSIVADSSSLKMSIATSSAKISIATTTDGSKEDNDCSDRGICDYTTGICSCSTGYDTSDGYGNEGQRGDCGYATASVTACPGETSCTGHGTCEGTPTYACQCSNGYTGADCSLYTCPYGNSWFSLPTDDEEAHLTTSKAECADMGLCDRTTGACSCMDGFEGAACDTMSCPGDPACNDHGDCLSMSALAEAATSNGDALDLTYGATPNDPDTWDFEMIQGCDCDDGYFGYDCSLMSCPSGDDPMTKYQYNEVQEITCETDDDDDGYFTLTFRQETTSSISVNADAGTVEDELEALSTITECEVYFDAGIRDDDASGTICSSSSTTFYVEFKYPTANVPLITYSSSGPTITVNEYQSGTKEYSECSGRGLCDYSTGLCSCFTGHGASDGQGNSGTIDNCGYLVPILSTD